MRRDAQSSEHLARLLAGAALRAGQSICERTSSSIKIGSLELERCKPAEMGSDSYFVAIPPPPRLGPYIWFRVVKDIIEMKGPARFLSQGKCFEQLGQTTVLFVYAGSYVASSQYNEEIEIAVFWTVALLLKESLLIIRHILNCKNSYSQLYRQKFNTL